MKTFLLTFDDLTDPERNRTTPPEDATTARYFRNNGKIVDILTDCYRDLSDSGEWSIKYLSEGKTLSLVMVDDGESVMMTE